MTFMHATVRRISALLGDTLSKAHDLEAAYKLGRMVIEEKTGPVFNGRFNENLRLMPDNGQSRVRLLTPDGVIYAAFSHYIRKSEDWGETWSSFITDETSLPYTVRQLGRFHTGELIVSCTNGRIYKSDENEANWRLVHEFGSGKGHSSPDFGFHVYGDIVLAASYGDPLEHAVVFLSVDRGETWREILSFRGDASPDPEVKHIHDVKFDPYEGIIWVTTGDDYLEERSVKNRILKSADWGRSWEEYRGYRATQIIPLPKNVLFIGDNAGRLSLLRYERPFAGSASVTTAPPRRADWLTTSEWPVEEAWFGAMLPDETTAGHWATNAAIRYGDQAAAVFGFFHGSVNAQPIKIWHTSDGLRFRVLWMSDVLGEREVNYVGGVFGPDNDGNLAAAVMLDSKWHLLKLQI